MDHEALLALYDRRRGCSRPLNTELFRDAGKEATMAAARRLGILQKGILVFDNEQEAAILADACLYAVRNAADETIVQRAARSGLHAAGSPAQEVLDAMTRAHFSLFALGDREPGVWVEAVDMFTQARYRVVDRGLSTAPSGAFATRLVDYPEFSTTTGAGMPIPTMQDFQALAAALDLKGFTPELLRAPDLPAKFRDDFYYTVAAHLLRVGVLRNTRYIDPTNPDEVARLEADVEPSLDAGDLFGPPQMPVRRESPKVGRNDPCHCGSGKKYKKCHGT